LVRAVQQDIAGSTTTGDFAWTATPAAQLTVALETLVGSDAAGPMAHFDPDAPHSWTAVTWTGTYTGPTTDAALTAATAFDTSVFANPIHGTLGWRLDAAGGTLSLTYTPVPEPGTLALLAAAACGSWLANRRSWRTLSVNRR
jgi:hypothetical protein